MEAGGGSTVLAIAEKGGVPLAETQRDMTPLQRQVLTLALKERQEKIEEEAPNNAGNSGGVGTRNARSGGKMSGETVQYVNENA